MLENGASCLGVIRRLCVEPPGTLRKQASFNSIVRVPFPLFSPVSECRQQCQGLCVGTQLPTSQPAALTEMTRYNLKRKCKTEPEAGQCPREASRCTLPLGTPYGDPSDERGRPEPALSNPFCLFSALAQGLTGSAFLV